MISDALLAWYDRHARVLPWRSPPGAHPPDPYRVWLSEIMLQQTTVAVVRPYFERFCARWPTVEALAAANEAELMAAWAGLGYYARARNLLACAKVVVAEHGGRFPNNEAALLRLPGIGAYTAAAIAAIAFGRRATVVDGNVERVVARLFVVDTPLSAAKSQLRAQAEALTPADRPGDYAQAMMDLGATICTPRKPGCALCPIRPECRAFASGEPERWAIKAAKLVRPNRKGIAFWIEHEGKVLLVTRPKQGLLGGMRALPTSSWGANPSVTEAPVVADWAWLGSPILHVFTHFALELRVATARLKKRCVLPPQAEWWPLDRLDEAGLPTVFAKAARVANGRDDVRPAA